MRITFDGRSYSVPTPTTVAESQTGSFHFHGTELFISLLLVLPS